MARRDDSLQARLDRDLTELKLLEIAKAYREVLDEAARKGSSILEVLAVLVGLEAASRQERALQRRLAQARLPKRKTLEEYDFNFPKRVPKAAIVRLFDCGFIEKHGCAVFIGPTGTGKSHFLTAFGYTAAERGYSVRYTRVVDMINHLTMNGLWAERSRITSVQMFSSSMSWAICPSTSAGPTCCSKWLRPVMKPDRSC
jgi:DNA replication protein DnaC